VKRFRPLRFYFSPTVSEHALNATPAAGKYLERGLPRAPASTYTLRRALLIVVYFVRLLDALARCSEGAG
jgi:hypothetical protein